VREASDAGRPPAAEDDDRVFRPIADAVAAWLGRN
jgi:ATP-binding protein involved in chromosome partitioning